ENKSVRSADGSTTDYYQCSKLKKLGAIHGRTIVRNNRLTNNPEAGHSELCAPIDKILGKILSEFYTQTTMSNESLEFIIWTNGSKGRSAIGPPIQRNKS
uniref:Uncharacterized protein n=1 Tax=Romanomermis culicivorax TaxID=13658 RepID=A0A915J111_ROMCU